MQRNTNRLITLFAVASIIAFICSCGIPSLHDGHIGPATTTATSQPTPPQFDIPRLDDLTIDGNPADWKDRGLSVAVLHCTSPHRLPADQFDAQIHLGWNEHGLLLLADVTDTDIHESNEELVLGAGTSIGVTETDSRGGESWQLTISPGVDPRHNQMRIAFYDERSKNLRKVPPSVNAAARRTAHGYLVEAQIPFEILAIAPKVGSDLQFTVRVNRAAGELPTQLVWNPNQSLLNPKNKSRLRLSDDTSPPINVAADAVYERFRRTRVTVTTTADQSGKIAQLRISDVIAGEAKLVSTGRVATADIFLPMPSIGKNFSRISLSLDGKAAGSVVVPEAEAARRAALEEQRLTGNWSVFTQNSFPDVDFVTPNAVEDLIGNYTLHTTFYDADLNPVTSAEKLGRYGATVEVKPESGKPFKRFVTLFRAPGDFNLRPLPLKAPLQIPADFGVDPAVAAGQSSANGDFVAEQIRTARIHGDSLAIYLAGLNEIPASAGDLPRRLGPLGRNISWWYELKKKTGNLVQYKYLTHLPDGVKPDSKTKVPLILFLHGSGERGSNLDSLRQHGPPKLLKTEPDWRYRNKFIVVSPQCPSGETWNPLLLRDLLDQVMARYPVDPDRVYLTGLSMGGFGTWELAQWFPDRFAAIVPICGGGDPDDVSQLKDIPTWVFHGQRDPAVRIECAYEMVQAMRNQHARIRFTIFPDRGHNSWVPAYDDPNLYDWLLRQRRGQPAQERSNVTGTQSDVPAP